MKKRNLKFLIGAALVAALAAALVMACNDFTGPEEGSESLGGLVKVTIPPVQRSSKAINVPISTDNIDFQEVVFKNASNEYTPDSNTINNPLIVLLAPGAYDVVLFAGKKLQGNEAVLLAVAKTSVTVTGPTTVNLTRESLVVGADKVTISDGTTTSPAQLTSSGTHAFITMPSTGSPNTVTFTPWHVSSGTSATGLPAGVTTVSGIDTYSPGGMAYGALTNAARIISAADLDSGLDYTISFGGSGLPITSPSITSAGVFSFVITTTGGFKAVAKLYFDIPVYIFNTPIGSPNPRDSDAVKWHLQLGVNNFNEDTTTTAANALTTKNLGGSLLITTYVDLNTIGIN
ncbi:hypothetical protein AGMMS49942_03170 [Spirochaetia bacterium]|nr:hypothetical protein AGMMS49942_03170 [Spirochaetia bacterium]